MNLKSLIWLHKYPHNAEKRRKMLNSGGYRSLGISEMVKLLIQNPGCDLDGDVAKDPDSPLVFFVDTATAVAKELKKN